MKEFSTKDLFNVLVLKNQLITLDYDKLKELYQDYDNYLLFLDSFSVLTNIDSGFLFLRDDILKKVEEIVNYNRFNTDPEVYNTINEIIQYLNLIKGYSSIHKKIFRDSYLAYQEEIRKIDINSIDELMRVLANDAYMVVALEEYDIDFISDDKLFMASLNYLIETAPEIFQNTYIYDFFNKHLNSMEVKPLSFSFKIKRLLRDTQNNYQKVKQKEE